MTGQIVIDSGRLVSLDGKPNAISDRSPVAEAFDRWQDGDFNAVERDFASQWRDQLSRVDLDTLPDILLHCPEFTIPCASLAKAMDLAMAFTRSTEAPYLKMEVCLRLLQMPPRAEPRIRERWAQLGFPSIHEFAPYAAFQLSVILFFFIALKTGLISSRRPSNLLDIAYLFYLPFCMVFVSYDRLHRELAPLFLRRNQEFVWGPDLKASLQEISTFYSLYSETDKAKGLHSFAPTPPLHVTTLVSEMWDRHLPSWRAGRSTPLTTPRETHLPDMVGKVEQMGNAPTLSPGPGELSINDIQSVTIKRRVRRKKGAWYQVPQSLKPQARSFGENPDGA
jgi:hypothetical protein